MDNGNNNTSELWSIENKAEVISNKIDIVINGTACEFNPLTQADVIGGQIILNTPGNY
jgi:hypothetical protein